MGNKAFINLLLSNLLFVVNLLELRHPCTLRAGAVDKLNGFLLSNERTAFKEVIVGFRAFLLDVTKNEVEDEQRLKANQRSFTKVVQQHSFYFPPCIERMRVARTVERVGGGGGRWGQKS